MLKVTIEGKNIGELINSFLDVADIFGGLDKVTQDQVRVRLGMDTKSGADLTEDELGHTEPKEAEEEVEKPVAKKPTKRKVAKKPAVVMPTAIEPVSLDAVKSRAVDLIMNQQKKPEVKAVIQEFAPTLDEVQPEDYEALYNKLGELNNA